VEPRAHHALIGAFVLLVTLAAAGFALWISKVQLDAAWDEYDVVFTEAVSGLTRGGIVQFHGIQVGEVRQLRLDPRDARRVIARIRVEGGTPIRTDTRAKLVFAGLTGVAVIQLQAGSPDAPLLQREPGADPPVIASIPSDFDRLLAGGADVMSGFQHALLQVSRLLDDANLARVSATLEHLEQLTGELAADRAEVKRLLLASAQAGEELHALAAELRHAVQGFRRWSEAPEAGWARIDAALKRAEQAFAALEASAQALTATVEGVRTPLTRFAVEGLPLVQQNLTELREVERELVRLGEALRRDARGQLLGPARGRAVERP
jgi:phospholipid/cholesterol/gamma-HCH transport system substrate-binding protein